MDPNALFQAKSCSRVVFVFLILFANAYSAEAAVVALSEHRTDYLSLQ